MTILRLRPYLFFTTIGFGLASSLVTTAACTSSSEDLGTSNGDTQESKATAGNSLPDVKKILQRDPAACARANTLQVDSADEQVCTALVRKGTASYREMLSPCLESKTCGFVQGQTGTSPTCSPNAKLYQELCSDDEKRREAVISVDGNILETWKKGLSSWLNQPSFADLQEEKDLMLTLVGEFKRPATTNECQTNNLQCKVCGTFIKGVSEVQATWDCEKRTCTNTNVDPSCH